MCKNEMGDFTHRNIKSLYKDMYLRMLGIIELSDVEYLILGIVTFLVIFYIMYVLIGDILSNDEDDDIDLWPK